MGSGRNPNLPPFFQVVSRAELGIWVVLPKSVVLSILSICLARMATIEIDDSVRDELREYKAKHGQTYSEAIVRLLEGESWFEEPEKEVPDV